MLFFNNNMLLPIVLPGPLVLLVSCTCVFQIKYLKGVLATYTSHLRWQYSRVSAQTNNWYVASAASHRVIYNFMYVPTRHSVMSAISIVVCILAAHCFRYRERTLTCWHACLAFHVSYPTLTSEFLTARCFTIIKAAIDTLDVPVDVDKFLCIYMSTCIWWFLVKHSNYFSNLVLNL